MTSPRAIAIWVAGLFIVATAASVASLPLLTPLATAPDPLVAVAGAPSQVVASVLLIFVASAAIIAIPVAFYPLLSRYSQAGALLYFAARIFESVAFLLGGIFTLGMLNAAQAGNADGFTLARDLGDAAYAAGPTLFFSLSALVLSVLLWGSRLVPRWLSGWKFIGALMMVVQGVLTLAGPLDPTLEATLFMPIAVNEMVLAGWLIVAGFDRKALARLGA